MVALSRVYPPLEFRIYLHGDLGSVACTTNASATKHRRRPNSRRGAVFFCRAVGQPGLEPGANGLREGTSEVA
jgi:hypothetical protein